MCNYRKERRAVDQRTFKIGSILEVWGRGRLCACVLKMCMCVKVRLQLWLVVCVFVRTEKDEGWIELGGQGRGVCM